MEMSVGSCAGPTHAPLYCVRERARPAVLESSTTASPPEVAALEAASGNDVTKADSTESSVAQSSAFVDISIGLEVYYAKASANYIFASQIYTKGSDASNL
jgi:hypothetical protein